MTAYEAQPPVHKVKCDRDGCEATFTPEDDFARRSDHRARWDAREAGWDVPPPSGKGSRSRYDYCPEHATR